MRDAFYGFHPVVNFTYFLAVLLFSMFFMHPVFLVISAVSATLYSVYLKGAKAAAFSVKVVLPMLLLAAVVNPAFNHQGVTILTYLPSGNPLTLESIIYGIAAAFMLASVIQWFSCYNEVMTSDKFVYLFGRVIPALSLVLSMTLRFVPKFKAQLAVVKNAQRCIGRDVSTGSNLQRLKNAVRILSIMITWALENAVETADSMKSRGYGLPGRSAFSIYRFEKRDGAALGITLALSAYVIAGKILGAIDWVYYPVMSGFTADVFTVSVCCAYGGLCLLPLILNIKEDVKWKRLQSEI